jgi:hypothetical protein
MRYLLILALFCCTTAVNAQKVKFIKAINEDGYDRAKSAIIKLRGGK